MHIKTFLTATSLALASITACAAERLTFQLDWLPNGDKAFAYVALKQGFYAAEGLDVSVVPGRDLRTPSRKLRLALRTFATVLLLP